MTHVPTDATDTELEDSDGVVEGRVFRIIGQQFLERPDRERIDSVGAWAKEWQRTADRLPTEIAAALERIEGGSDADEATLGEAYTHLFRGISERSPDPPYESLYVDGQFYSDTTTDILRGYRWAGVDVDDAQGNEPPDHLGLELQFVGELIGTEADGPPPDDGNSEEPDLEDAKWWMLDEHLTEWLPTYHAHIQREEPVEYYAGLLDLALAVVKAHHSTLARKR